MKFVTARGHGDIEVRYRLWGRWVPGSKPDSTKTLPCMCFSPCLLHVKSCTVIKRPPDGVARKFGEGTWCQLRLRPRHLTAVQNYKSKLALKEYERFLTNGWFTIRRSDKYWSGICTDLTILKCTSSQQVEDFYGLSVTTSEHHTDARDSRILRHNEDVQKLVGWLESRNPISCLRYWMSISTGILGDETMNFHGAFNVIILR
ncbi:hypothetical protein AVEN_223163-1 [Araneus ventricosus]|uniref:Uncharacterized protein n=1 Tax=Araneus ventricosus TaxID=182803 RepID=A0A4Y2FS20_ARAVE|nr:hypothetical protein AVEN_223163-1 [Araneus ventricosus]